MDNQHRQIKGYRELNADEIDLMNRIKQKAAEVGELVAELQEAPPFDISLDQRWISIGKTNLQQGFMALVRGVAQPTGF